jgi:poly(A) polymerase
MFDETGRILRDNVYGTIDADVWRRDFTANSLYYNIADFSVWDYCGGVEDVRARVLKLIGDPETRFREDPVRMLRAARFEAKLNFTMDPATAEPIDRLRDLLGGVPPARLFDETLKLFLGGHGARSFEVLRRRGLLAALLPTVDAYLVAHPGSLVEKLLLQGLKNTDSRVQADKPVTPTFLFALLLYGPIAGIIEAMPPEHWHELGAILDACDLAARQAQTQSPFRSAFLSGCGRCSPCSRGWSIRAAGARCGCSSIRASGPPTTCCCCVRSSGWRPTEMAQWWTRIQEVSLKSVARWPMRSAAAAGLERRALLLAARTVAAAVAAVARRRRRRGAVLTRNGSWSSGTPLTSGSAAISMTRRRKFCRAFAKLAELPRTRKSF